MPETLERSAAPRNQLKAGIRCPTSPLLDAKIRGLRRRHVVVAVFLTGLAIALSVFVELLALEMFRGLVARFELVGAARVARLPCGPDFEHFVSARVGSPSSAGPMTMRLR